MPLTTYEEVVAQIGISQSELLEDTYNDFYVEDELELDLYEWFPNYQQLSDYAAADPDTLRQQKALAMYCRVFCARSIMATAPMRFVQQTGDGENVQKRFTSATALRDFLSDLGAKLSKAKDHTLAVTTAMSPVAQSTGPASFPGMVISSPSVDVITGR